MLDLMLKFGPFQLFPDRGLLLKGGKPVALSSRALDILAVLLEKDGEVVSKQELMARVWPGTVVVDASLRVHLVALRRALRGEHGEASYICNVSGRGYRFVEPIVRQWPDPRRPLAMNSLPAPILRLIGRADAVDALVRELPARRLASVVGGGGIGKTSVALAAGQQLAAGYADGASFVDLSPLTDAALVPAALAASFGVSVLAEAGERFLLQYLRAKKMLLLLDNCEHLVAGVAALVETLLRHCPGVHVLATSREPLGVEGEWLYRLPPLAAPPPQQMQQMQATRQPATAETAAAVLVFPAAQLFVERAAAALGEFTLSDADAPLLAQLCRQLDGMPLAIELAASRIDLFGIAGLAARLDDCLSLLTRSRRTAQARHRTLRATLDWSFELLPEAEKIILRRLAVFAGGFNKEAAVVVAAGDGVSEREVLEGLENLAAKSLLNIGVDGGQLSYHLLQLTRAYAKEKLDGSVDARARPAPQAAPPQLERAVPGAVHYATS
ncbi:winged helix-turn-helix domain-containing protein [Rugamonas sp.]|uniref:ATP-binding protein n=1 Tax=Rugamonas sp. TaxID=1926287 RepID=UPI0025DD27DB|nr:winged helix-turn-helix domain-containing protein [Rugamonas sp.]